jgi:hypothetical protein
LQYILIIIYPNIFKTYTYLFILTELGDNCILDSDCLFDKAAKCILQKCTKVNSKTDYKSLDSNAMFYLNDESGEELKVQYILSNQKY